MTDQATGQAQKTVIPYQQIDYSSALSLSETRTITDSIFHDFCGIIRIKQPNGQLVYKRISKPVLTYDFANKLMTEIFNIANRITARTTFTEREIKRYCYTNGKALMMEMAVSGMQHLISNRVWEKAIEYSMPKYKITGTDNKETLLSEWQYCGIGWSYDNPFNIDALNYVKRKEDLEDESFGQDVLFKTIFWQVMTFIHGSLNRSQNALTLDHEKIIHKESVVQSETQTSKPSESVLDNIKDKVRRMTGAIR